MDTPFRTGYAALYLSLVKNIEEVQSALINRIKRDLLESEMSGITPVQALLLLNIAEKEVYVGQLKSEGHYLGTNVSYNLKKMVEEGYLQYERMKDDKRRARVKLSPKGYEVRNRMITFLTAQSSDLEDLRDFDIMKLEAISLNLAKLERFLSS